MYEEWIDKLKLSVLFKSIDGRSLSSMLKCLSPGIRRYKQREIIVSCGDLFQSIGIIAGGRVALTKETFSGNRIIMGILDAGEIFGEAMAFSNTWVWPVTVLAQEDCTLLFLPPEKIAGVCANTCSSHSTLIVNLLQVLSNKNIRLSKKIEHISAKTVRGKVSSYLIEIYRQQNLNTLTLPLKRHELADYLNISRPSLSREMALMRDADLIEFEGKLVKIKNLYALEKSLR